MKQVFRELIVDNFSGGGGAGTGIELATGRSVDIAINHDLDAIAMHKTNHPTTQHYCESVWDVVPRDVVNGQPVALAWFSPDCKHFSKAKGGKPVDKNIRGLAWVALRWAATVKPRVIMLENVEEFQTWGPIDSEGKPCKKRKGQTFESFKRALERQGYTVEHRELRACDYGAPTIRKRLFLVARRDGQPIIWPKPTHGDPDSKAVKQGKLLPYRTAAECIDWSIPCPSIFLSKEEARVQGVKRPLAEKTLKRIAKGMQRYVIDSTDPFIVTLSHGEGSGKTKRWGSGVREANKPLPTVTATGGYGVVMPFITEHANSSNQRNMSGDEPLRTQCAGVKGGHFALVSAFLAKHYTGVVGASVLKPVPTVTTVDHSAVVTSHLVKLRNGCHGQSSNEPMHTITSSGGHFGEVRAFLLKYYGTATGQDIDDPLHSITSKERFGLVTIKGQQYQIADIGMRMLKPHELFKAQGFPDDYIIDRDYTGKKMTQKAQVARCGNSVPPPFAEHLVRANLPELCSGGDYYDANSPRAVEAS